MIHPLVRSIVLLVVLALAAQAQGSVATQGYGYPTG